MALFGFRKTQKPEDLDRKLVFSLRAKAQPGIPKFRQLRFLPRILTVKERWIIHTALALLLLALAGFIGVTLRDHLVFVPRDGGTYREAFQGIPRFINPVLAVSDVDKDLSRLIYSGLVRYNDKGQLVGDLAQDFTLENDGKTLRFVLKEGLLWHDGTAVTVDDIIFTIESIQSAAWRSPLWQTFQGVTVEKVDERTVLTHTPGPGPNFAATFTVGIIPRHIWAGVDRSDVRIANWNLKPVGAGPFRFKSLTKNADGIISFYRLVRFDQYRSGRPHIKEFVAQFFPDFDAALAALRTHATDGVSFIPERLRSKVPVAATTINKFFFPRFTALFFQDRKSETLKDRNVRRALAQAVDREAVVSRVPDAQVAFSPFLPWQVGYARTLEFPKYSQEEALNLLTTSGFTLTDGKLIKDNKKLQVTLTALDDPIQLAVADTIKNSWEELGVEVKLEAVSRYVFSKEVLQPRAFEIVLFSFVTGIDPDPYPFWHSTQIDDPGVNLSSVKSRVSDNALELGRATADSKVRLLNYIEFQKKFFEEVPAVVLYSSPYVYVTVSRVRGMQDKIITTPADRFNDVANWFVRSRIGWR